MDTETQLTNKDASPRIPKGAPSSKATMSKTTTEIRVASSSFNTDLSDTSDRGLALASVQTDFVVLQLVLEVLGLALQGNELPLELPAALALHILGRDARATSTTTQATRVARTHAQ